MASVSVNAKAIELWGGVECTMLRAGDMLRDQVKETGHFDRFDDLKSIASLGIRTLRYPILWESIYPQSMDHGDWRWHDARLAELQRLGIRPVAGLVHHGGGHNLPAC